MQPIDTLDDVELSRQFATRPVTGPDDEALELRRQLFRETLYQTGERHIFGTHFAVSPGRIRHLPTFLKSAALDALRGGTRVPDPARVVACPDLFGGISRNISAETIIAAAKVGFSPWCHIAPLKWWTWEQRMVLFFDEHHMAKRLRRDMRAKGYRVTFDSAFEKVIKACAGRRSYRRHGLTWITPQVMYLYADLFDQGVAHSFEVWNSAGELVGGGFGTSLGRIFITDSQFSFEPNTSKMGFASLNYHLANWGYVLNDGKCFTPTIDAMGFRLIPRAEHLALLRHASEEGRPGRWSVEADLATVAKWQSKAEIQAATARPAKHDGDGGMPHAA